MTVSTPPSSGEAVAYRPGPASYAGIREPYRLGAFGVEENARRLHRLAFVHACLMRIGAAHLPARCHWDLKVALGRHLYEDAEAATALRARVLELRTSPARLEREPDARLALALQELLHADSDAELLLGLYTVWRPALLAAVDAHIRRTQPVVDAPTVRILRRIRTDLEEQVDLGQELLAAFREDPLDAESLVQAATFVDRQRAYLQAAGGVAGDQPLPEGVARGELPRPWRSHRPYQLPLRSRRDPRRQGPTTWARTGVAAPPEDPVARRLVAMMRVRQEEMTAAELVAGVLYAQTGMPWEFYADLARHCWDEVRHCLFGQAALERDGWEWASRPQYTSDYDLAAPKIAAARYAWLAVGIEGGAMAKGGKQAEFTFCRDEARHPLMAQFQDYDWADEVLHARLGRRWAPELLGDASEDAEETRVVAQRELDEFWRIVGEHCEAYTRTGQVPPLPPVEVAPEGR
jgi:hypothetical protein